MGSTSSCWALTPVMLVPTEFLVREERKQLSQEAITKRKGPGKGDSGAVIDKGTGQEDRQGLWDPVKTGQGSDKL